MYTLVFKLLRSSRGRKLVVRGLKNKRLRSFVYRRLKAVLTSKRARYFVYETAKRGLTRHR